MPSHCLKDNRLQVTAYVKLRLQKNLFCIFVNGSFFISYCLLITAFPIQFWFSLEKFYTLNYIQFVWNVFELHMFCISNVAIHIHFERVWWIIWYWAKTLFHLKWKIWVLSGQSILDISPVCVLKINNLSFSYFCILDNYLKKDATTHHQRYKGHEFCMKIFFVYYRCCYPKNTS